MKKTNPAALRLLESAPLPQLEGRGPEVDAQVQARHVVVVDRVSANVDHERSYDPGESYMSHS